MHCNNYILCILVLLNAFFHVHAERFKIENFDIFNLIDACEAPSFIQYWAQYLPGIEKDDVIDNGKKIMKTSDRNREGC